VKKINQDEKISQPGIENLTTCPSREELVAWVYGEADDTALLEKHFLECDECRHKINDLRETMLFLDESDPLNYCDKDDNIVHNTLARLNQKLQRIEEEILDIGELSRYLKLPETEILEILSELPYFTVQGHIRFRLSAVREWTVQRELSGGLRKNGSWDKLDNVVDISGYFAKNVV
jgi:hypothetical protein